MLIADYIKKISPGWAQDGQLERYLFAIGDSIDAILEKVLEGQLMHIPTTADPTGLPYIGQDSLIAQGGGESVQSYRDTLQQRYDLWRMAGLPWAVLRQTLRPLLPLRPAIKQISNSYDPSAFPWSMKSTTWKTYAAGDTPETTQPATTLDEPGDFDWDSVQTCPGSWNWKRFWIVIESVGANAWCNPRSDTWDDLGRISWDTLAGCWDIDADPELLSTIWDKIELWKRACECVALIISFDASHFDPSQPSGGGINPDGTYGRWSVMSGNQQIAGRTSIANAVYGHRVQ